MSQHRISRRNYSPISGNVPELAPFTFARYSVACERHPERNEDSLVADARSGLAAVFDGVGGSAAGEIASQIAARSTRQSWKQTLQKIQKGRSSTTLLDNCSQVNLFSLLEQLILEADEKVRTDGARRAGTDDLATTVVLAALCKQSGKKGYIMTVAHVGDSRAYLLREHEQLQRLTNDDGLLGKLVDNQIVNEEDALRIDQAMHANQLTDVEFSYFRLRGGITQALGGPIPPVIHIDQIPIYPGDRILLCTDGIHDNLTDNEIEEILRKGSRTTVARQLVEQSVLRSHQERSQTVRAKPDDMSAVVVTCRF